ncbi:FMN-dependent NADH-azoreductase [Pseudochryseolinea flava]|uniref:FMN dependent NADH:quinone oxidoreductase n=1 Tax=Pseudochryseolinea flava TaxID=2059302 RepID=A0A364Y715_9BACT|nr:NAD(P)H-dependent oxidoreductase [Pseudochryseolinea flava]RAW02851.1 FMN-dependent NADH-azoreductase [Pseudochryseolinea flava]
MKKILHLLSSIQGNNAYSTKLSNAIVEKVIAKYPGSTVERVDLVEKELPHLNAATLQSMFTPEEELTSAGKAALRYSDEAVQQLMASDIIVIGAPLYNFSVHSALKSWMDHITRAGITFAYSEHGPVGKLMGKKVYVAMSSGGVYSEGPAKGYDFVAPYLTTFFSFLGITDVSVFRAEGLKVTGIKEQGFERGVASIVID